MASPLPFAFAGILLAASFLSIRTAKPRDRDVRALVNVILLSLVFAFVVGWHLAILDGFGLASVPAFKQSLQEKIPSLRLIVIGVLLVVLIMYRPEGLVRERKRRYPKGTRS